MKLKNVNNMQTLAALIFDCLQSTEIIARAAGDSDQYGGQFPSNKTGSLIFFFTKPSEIDVRLLFPAFFIGMFS